MTSNIQQQPPTRQAWLQKRRTGIGGSDVAAILGMSPWGDAWSVWTSKMMEPDESPETAYQKRGRYLEVAIGLWYADHHGVTVTPGPYHQVISGPEPWMLASPDFLVGKAPYKYGLEAKTSRYNDHWGDDGTDHVPTHYMLQCMWYMACLDVDRWDMSVFLTYSDEFRWYTIHRDPEVESVIVGRCRDWWQHHIVEKNEPSMTGSEAASEWLKHKYADRIDRLQDASQEQVDLAQQLVETRRKKNVLEEREREIKNLLLNGIENAAGFQWDGGKLTAKTTKTTRFDIDLLKAEHPDIYKQYCTKESLSQRVTPIFYKDDKS